MLEVAFGSKIVDPTRPKYTSLKHSKYLIIILKIHSIHNKSKLDLMNNIWSTFSGSNNNLNNSSHLLHLTKCVSLFSNNIC